MKTRFEKSLFAVAATVLVSAGTAAGVFAALDACARERENTGMLVASGALFRKIPGGNALFCSAEFSPRSQRAVLMLAREPRNETEYGRCLDALKRLRPPEEGGLVLADDAGTVLLRREPSRSRKVFGLADELKLLFVRLKSVPVHYFPSDAARAGTRLDVWCGDEEFPVSAAPEEGGAR